jgi:hypothetical protein
MNQQLFYEELVKKAQEIASNVEKQEHFSAVIHAAVARSLQEVAVALVEAHRRDKVIKG